MIEYAVNTKAVKNIGKVIGVHEYIENLPNAKWKKPKQVVGTTAEPITDSQLTEFIDTHNVFEICLSIKDKKGEMRHIDFSLEDLKK